VRCEGKCGAKDLGEGKADIWVCEEGERYRMTLVRLSVCPSRQRGEWLRSENGARERVGKAVSRPVAAIASNDAVGKLVPKSRRAQCDRR